MRAIKRNMKDQILTEDRRILHCRGCDAQFSGNAGDYGMVADDYIFTCADCGVEMELVRKITTVDYA